MWMPSELDESIYALIETHGLAEVLKSVNWIDEAMQRARSATIAASPSAKTIPAKHS
jgi:hypothetical protein